MADLGKLWSQTSAYADYLQQPIEQKNIFFLTSKGAGKQNLLMHLYDSMKKQSLCQGNSIYWAVSREDKKTEEWCGQNQIAWVSWEEDAYLRLLATSAILISDVTLPVYFSRRPGQTHWNLGAIRDREGRTRKYRPGYDQDVLLWRYGQNFLQSTHILATSEEDVRLLRDDYHLENAYDGCVCQMDGFDLQDAQMDSLSRRIFQEDSQADEKENLRFPVKKRRVLIQLNWNKRDYLREWVRLWLEYADYDRYDVTLATMRPREPVDIYKLAQLPKQARVLIQRGYMLTGLQQKEEEKEYARDFWLLSEDERMASHPDIQVAYENEWRKIFGDASFDAVLLTSLRPFWLLGAKKHCGEQIFISSRELEIQADGSSERLDRWQNKWEALKQMKAVYWFGTEQAELGEERNALLKLPTPVPAKWLKGDTGQLTILQCQGREYALLLQGKDWRELRGEAEFIPAPPAGQRAYVASGDLSGILPLFRRLCKKEPDSSLYVFVGDLPVPDDAVEEELKDCVIPIGGTVCGDMPGAFDYFRRFCGALLLGEEDPGQLASLLGILGKPIYREKDGRLEEISIQVDQDSLYEQGKEAVNHIWEK